MDFAEQHEASPLGAAVRRLTFDPRPEQEPPDDPGLLPTVLATAEDAGDSRIIASRGRQQELAQIDPGEDR